MQAHALDPVEVEGVEGDDRRRRFPFPLARGPNRLGVGPDVAILEPSGQTRFCSGGTFRKGDSLSLVSTLPCFSLIPANILASGGRAERPATLAVLTQARPNLNVEH